MPSSSSGEDAGSAACLVAESFAVAIADPESPFCSYTAKHLKDTSALWRAVQAAEQVFAAALALCSLPVLLIGAAIVTVLSRRAPFVAHRRVGLAGEQIWVLKLRTMWDDSRVTGRPRHWLEYLHDTPVPCSKPPRDPRVSSLFAALCRRFSIDELPQLWQVASGTLALIGPRPLTATELERYYGDAARTVVQVKPGITGLWQVRGRDRLTYKQRRRLDLFMIERWSFRLYFRILLASVPGVLSGKNAF